MLFARSVFIGCLGVDEASGRRFLFPARSAPQGAFTTSEALTSVYGGDFGRSRLAAFLTSGTGGDSNGACELARISGVGFGSANARKNLRLRAEKEKRCRHACFRGAELNGPETSRYV